MLEVLQYILQEADKLSFAKFILFLLKLVIAYAVITFSLDMIKKFNAEFVPVAYDSLKRSIRLVVTAIGRFIRKVLNFFRR